MPGRGVRVGFTGQPGYRMRLPPTRRQDRRLRNRQSRVKVNKSVHESVIMDVGGSTEAAPPAAATAARKAGPS